MQTMSLEQTEMLEKTEGQALENLRKQLRKIRLLFADNEIRLMICMESWIKNGSEIFRIKSKSPVDLTSYESVLVVYPVRHGNVLRNKRSGEILCAVVVFQKWEISGDETIYVRDQNYQEKIIRQLKEAAEELMNFEYIEYEGESKIVRENARVTIEERQYI